MTATAVVAAALAMTLATPDRQVVLTVDAGKLGEDAVAISDGLTEKAEALLTKEGWTVTAPADDVPHIRVAISWVDPKTFHYEIAITAEKNGAALAEPDTFPCKDCITDDLFASVLGRLPALLPELADEGAPPRPPNGHDKPDKKWRPPVVAGGVLMGVGAVGIVIGGVFIARDETAGDNRDPRQVESTKFRTAGIIALSLGLGAFTAGVAALAVGLTRRRRSKRRAALAPMLSPTVAGMTLTARF